MCVGNPFAAPIRPIFLFITAHIKRLMKEAKMLEQRNVDVVNEIINFTFNYHIIKNL